MRNRVESKVAIGACQHGGKTNPKGIAGSELGNGFELRANAGVMQPHEMAQPCGVAIASRVCPTGPAARESRHAGDKGRTAFQ